MADSKIPVCFDIDLRNIGNTTGSIVPLINAASKARIAAVLGTASIDLLLYGIEQGYENVRKNPIHKARNAEFDRRMGALTGKVNSFVGDMFEDIVAGGIDIINAGFDIANIGDTEVERLQERAASQRSRHAQAQKDLKDLREKYPDGKGQVAVPSEMISHFGFSPNLSLSYKTREQGILNVIADSQKKLEDIEKELARRGISPETQRQPRSIGNTRSNLGSSSGNPGFFDEALRVALETRPTTLQRAASALGSVPAPSVDALYGKSNISSLIGNLNTPFNSIGSGTGTGLQPGNTQDIQTWSEGVQTAYADISKSANDWGAISQDLTHKVFNGMTDAVVDFATTGKANFSEFARSLVADLLRISTQQLLVNALGGFSFFSPNVKAAMGAVIDGGHVQAFARGGVVSQPAYFGLRNGGLGLMAEAGPEAIMPLRRGRNGKLGVASEAPPPTPVNVRVVNVTDPHEITTAMNTGAGERVILNTIVNNHDTIRKLLRVG